MLAYQQTLEAIYRYVDYSRTRQVPYNASTYNLERMRELCRRLGHPENDYPTLHIAGSKGKGSTAAMVAAILQAAGYRTGLYTSPHLHSFRERIRINGELIPQERVVALWEQMRPEVEALPQTTAFEIITALAFLDFSQQRVDRAVIEVGLGGRLDATNVIRPAACAITSLSLEHTELLGSTLDRIAYEKAGIIKPGVPVVSATQAPEAAAVIAEVAARNAAPLWWVGENGDWRFTVRAAGQHGLLLELYGPDVTYTDLWVPLVGRHQALNAGMAVAAVHALNDTRLTPEVVRRGLAQTSWPGRLERLPRRPGTAMILVDGAHNRHSAEQVLAALPLFPHARLILLFGASADKDIAGMLEVLGPVSDAIVVTRSYHPRAADPHDLAALARTVAPTKPVFVAAEAATALQMALEQTTAADLILGIGSLFLVADVRSAWCALYPGAFPASDWVHAAEPFDGSFVPVLTR